MCTDKNITGMVMMKTLMALGFENVDYHGYHHILYSKEKNKMVSVRIGQDFLCNVYIAEILSCADVTWEQITLNRTDI